MQSKAEKSHALVRAGFCGTLTGGFIGTKFGLISTAFMIYKLERFDSKKLSLFLLVCFLATPVCAVTGAAAGGAFSLVATVVGKRTFSFFQRILAKQDSQTENTQAQDPSDDEAPKSP